MHFGNEANVYIGIIRLSHNQQYQLIIFLSINFELTLRGEWDESEVSVLSSFPLLLFFPYSASLWTSIFFCVSNRFLLERVWYMIPMYEKKIIKSGMNQQ